MASNHKPYEPLPTSNAALALKWLRKNPGPHTAMQITRATGRYIDRSVMLAAVRANMVIETRRGPRRSWQWEHIDAQLSEVSPRTSAAMTTAFEVVVQQGNHRVVLNASELVQLRKLLIGPTREKQA